MPYVPPFAKTHVRPISRAKKRGDTRETSELLSCSIQRCFLLFVMTLHKDLILDFA